MSYLPSDEANPFRAPEARIGDYGTDLSELDRGGDAELIRRAHINHEVSVKTLGVLYYVGTAFGVVGTVILFVLGAAAVPFVGMNPPNQEVMSPQMIRGVLLGFGVFLLALTVFQGFLAYGLRGLQAWARWTVIVFTALSLLYNLVVCLVAAITSPVSGLGLLVVGSLVPGYILYLMASPKGSMVFSAEYKAVIRKTPHVKAKTGLIVKIALVLLVAIFLLIVVAALMNQRG